MTGASWLIWAALACFALAMVGPWRSKPKTRREIADFYRSSEWKAVQRQTEAENRRWFGRPTCERCGARPDHWWPWKRRRMHTDHIYPRSLYPHLELTQRWTQELCSLCNTTKGNRCTINWKRLRRWRLAPVRWALIWWQRLVLGWNA